MDAETLLAATEIVLNRQLVEHEAAHAAAALLLGIPVDSVSAPFHTFASLEGCDPDDPAGHVLVETGDDPERMRKMAIAVLAGPIEDTVGWPPRWPLSLVPEAGDEAQLVGLVKRLDLDEPSYGELVQDAYQLASSSEYERLRVAVEHLLERDGRLDAHALNAIKAVALEGGEVERKTLGATTVDTDQELGTFEAIASAWDADREHDVIERTAFDETIRAWRTSGKRLPLLFEHSTEAVGHIDPHSMRATDEGLLVAGEVDRDTEKGRQVWGQIKRGTAGFSIGFMAESRPRPGKGRRLTAIDLLEISATSTPVHAATRAVNWKSADPDDVPSLDELRDRERELGLDDEQITQGIADEFHRLLTDAMSDAHTNGNGDDPKSLDALRHKTASLEREYAPVQVATFGC